jgi:type IX secretion system PorP/SprF family membrane protein
MKLKKYLIICQILSSGLVFAQFDPQFSQYMFNGLVINPAIAGSKDNISANLQYKRQFINNGILPEIKSFSIHAPFKFQRIGLGFQVSEEKFSIQNRTSASFSYAYKINLAKGVLSFGISAGLMQSTIKYSDLRVYESEHLSDLNVIMPDLGSGLYFQSKKYYLGLSALHLIPNTWTKSNYAFNYNIIKRHLMLTAGYKLKISEKLALLPTTLMKWIPNEKFMAELTLHLKYEDLLWGGFSMRTNELYSLQAGVRLSDLLTLSRQSIKLGYAYDWSNSGVNLLSRGSHEIMLILDLKLYESPSKIRKGKINISPVLF